MAQIDTAISESGFEILKKRIGVVLKTELDNQKILLNLEQPINVYVDRMTPFDKSEIFVINVRFDSLSKNNQGQFSSQDTITYNVDVYATAKHNNNQRGDNLSSEIRDRFLGIIANILDSNIYNTLLLQNNAIMSTNVENIDAYEAQGNQDANFVSMGRLNYSVKIYQDYKTWQGVAFNQNLTDVKLSLTELGYKYETIN